MILDVSHAVWNRDACQTAAVIERNIANAGHAVWNRNARQAAAIIEHTPLNASHAVWNRDARQTAAPNERIFTNANHAAWNGDACQTAAVIERIFVNAGHAVWNRDARQTVAITERKFTNANHAAWNGDADKICTTIKSMGSYTGCPVFYGYIFDLIFPPRTAAIYIIVRHFAISGNRQCPLGIQRPAQILLVPFPAAIAGRDDIRREAYRRQRGQCAQGKHKRDEPAENPRLLFHGNSLFLLLSLVNTTWFYCTQEKSSSQQVCRKNGENR